MKVKKKDMKIQKAEKWHYCESILLRYLLSTYHRLPLWNMANITVMNEKVND